MVLHPNEIRDYLSRAPRRFHFEGKRMINNTAARFHWLAAIASGTIDQRINRRAGITDTFTPFKNPIYASIQRHRRHQLFKLYGRNWATLAFDIMP